MESGILFLTLGIIVGVVIIFLVASFWATQYKEKKYNYSYDPTEARPGLLRTHNGIGLTFIGSFRKKEFFNGL